MNCDHKGCHCSDATLEREGKKFCSENCADARNESASSASSACRCGHPDCAAV